jgi:hypothetical protein
MSSHTTDTAAILRDYLSVYTTAVECGDTHRAAEALATIHQATHLALLDLDPAGMVSGAMTHDNGRYVPPVKL